MVKGEAFLELGAIRVDRRKKEPLGTQLYSAIRQGILEGNLPRGLRLPSTRALAHQLGVSRTIVVNVFEQLQAEGYLAGQTGAGTFVRRELPEETQIVRFGHHAHALPCAEEIASGASDLASNRERGRVDTKAAVVPWDFHDRRPFRPGIPALDRFPVETWGRLFRKALRDVGPEQLSYGDPQGFAPLRRAIADYVRAYRGVRCDESQVMIVNGTQQATDLVTRLRTQVGDKVLLENPGYLRARQAFLSAGLQPSYVSVDRNGMDVDEVERLGGAARLCYVTPSHQFPMGVTLSLDRRMQLIDWANRNDATIIEDDYDSEFRYAQRPIPAMQGLDHGDRTVYVGSFSKVVYPSLGIGYAVVPRSMVAGFRNLLEIVSRPPSTIEQIVLAEFIVEGHFARHVRRMSTVHNERRGLVVSLVQKHLSHALKIVGADAGLHCTALLSGRWRDWEIAERAWELGVTLRPLSEFFADGGKASGEQSVRKGGRASGDRAMDKRWRNGLVFGYAASTPAQIRTAFRTIAPLFSER